MIEDRYTLQLSIGIGGLHTLCWLWVIGVHSVGLLGVVSMVTSNDPKPLEAMDTLFLSHLHLPARAQRLPLKGCSVRSSIK